MLKYFLDFYPKLIVYFFSEERIFNDPSFLCALFHDYMAPDYIVFDSTRVLCLNKERLI